MGGSQWIVAVTVSLSRPSMLLKKTGSLHWPGVRASLFCSAHTAGRGKFILELLYWITAVNFQRGALSYLLTDDSHGVEKNVTESFHLLV